jgi:hypothetical protein
MVNAKVGDKVMIIGVSGWRRTRWVKVFTVEKETKTQVVCCNGNRYNRSSGLKIGDGESGYSERTYIQDYDEELVTQIRDEMAFYEEKDKLETLVGNVADWTEKLRCVDGVPTEDVREAATVLTRVLEILSKGQI